MLQLRDARTDQVTPVAGARAGALRVHACAIELRSLLVADLVRRAATLSHDLFVRVTASGVHRDAAALNIHPAEVVDGAPDADVRIGCTTGTGLLVEAGAVSPDPLYREAAKAADSATPVVPGQQETSATVSVTFSLR